LPTPSAGCDGELNRGEIPGYKVGHEWRMTEADVEAFIDSRRKPLKAAPAVGSTEPEAPFDLRDQLSALSSAAWHVSVPIRVATQLPSPASHEQLNSQRSGHDPVKSP
jgi:hypothetical protein